MVTRDTEKIIFKFILQDDDTGDLEGDGVSTVMVLTVAPG